MFTNLLANTSLLHQVLNHVFRGDQTLISLSRVHIVAIFSFHLIIILIAVFVSI